MTEQLKEPQLSLAGKMRVSLARLLLRCSRALAYAIAPELRAEADD